MRESDVLIWVWDAKESKCPLNRKIAEKLTNIITVEGYADFNRCARR